MGWFSDLYRKIMVGSQNSPQAAMTARGPGTRKAPGDDCLCGKGIICRAYSPIHGWFLGCTQLRVTGCRHAWTIGRQETAEELEIMRRWRLKFPSFIGGWCGDAGKRVRGPAWCRGLPGLLGFVW